MNFSEKIYSLNILHNLHISLLIEYGHQPNNPKLKSVMTFIQYICLSIEARPHQYYPLRFYIIIPHTMFYYSLTDPQNVKDVSLCE